MLRQSRDVHVSAIHVLLYETETLVGSLISSGSESLDAQEAMLF